MREHLDEKALNSVLSSVMAEHNRAAEIGAEKSGKLLNDPGKRGAQPDVTVVQDGREPVLIENKYDNKPDRGLVQQCEGRLSRKWANGLPVRAVIGLRTPHRMGNVADVEAAIREASDFRWAAWTFGATRLPQTGWIEGSIAEFVGFVDRVGAEAGDTEQLAAAVRGAIDSASALIGTNSAAARGFGDVLLQAPCEQTNRMAMAVMFNAIVFQSHIAKHHDAVLSPTQMLAEDASQLAVLRQWQTILDINYWPIFGVSRQLLGTVSDETAAGHMLSELFNSAVQVASVPGAQGLAGRIFGELIGDRKFLATFYTLPSSSALLAELAVERLNVDWSDPRALAELRVGDMCCGTGALLTAAYARIRERHLLAGGDPETLHNRFVEDVLIGCDIMPAAVHLTAARLSGEYPNVDYTSTKTWVMPYGSHTDEGGAAVIKLGSLDLLDAPTQEALFGDGSIAATSKGEQHHTTANVAPESLDLVIMNPPFTRPTNHESHHRDIPNPAFAGLGNDAASQEQMSKALKRRLAKLPEPRASHGNAGLASNFVDLAHAKLCPGGTLALVLPAAAVSGGSWRATQELLSDNYEDITIATIASQGKRTTDRAFSADTDMGEVLVIARKRDNAKSRRPTGSKRARFVTLADRPATVASAVEVARSTRGAPEGAITVGDDEVGWSMNSDFGSGGGHPTGVGEPDAARFAAALTNGRLRLSRVQEHTLPMTDLGSLGDAGPVHRDINGTNRRNVKGKTVSAPRGPFDIKVLQNRALFDRASYPALWSHDAAQETQMEVLPDTFARPRHGMQHRALQLWVGEHTHTHTHTHTDSRDPQGCRSHPVTHKPRLPCYIPSPRSVPDPQPSPRRHGVAYVRRRSAIRSARHSVVGEGSLRVVEHHPRTHRPMVGLIQAAAGQSAPDRHDARQHPGPRPPSDHTATDRSARGTVRRVRPPRPAARQSGRSRLGAAGDGRTSVLRRARTAN